MSDISVKKFFLASHTCEGFFSVFNHLYYPKNGWFCYILKGGPGTGKSTLMKKFAAAAEKKYSNVELIFCSSDPNSLDAVIIPELKVCIADGTAPHVLEPKYPGIAEKIINLGECWSEGKLQKNSKNLMQLFETNKQYHEKAALFLKSLGNIQKSKNIILEKSVNEEEVQSFAKKLLPPIFKGATNRQMHIEHMRMIDAITPHGHIFFDKSITEHADKVYILEDKHEIAANRILQAIRHEAINNKMEFISFPSPFSPKYNLHAIHIPEISTAFIYKNSNFEIDTTCVKKIKKINATKFLNSESLKSHRNLLSLYEKTSSLLLDSAVENLSKALEIHDEIEKTYISSMNFKKINKIADKLISAIL